ncbi:hypothetical protein [Paenarthrobacter sp. YIM B13468]|uniref:hypothetical protein n=1 Tax=Paenarthrobacter sp. YIM B13468 TaxID=3366295 RepID=UPI0036732F5C
MTISQSELSGFINVYEGVAVIGHGKQPNADQRALIPGADEAFAAFEAQNSAAIPLRAERKKLSQELTKLRRAKHPAHEYDQNLDDELTRRRAQIDLELRRNALAARKLGTDYLDIVWNIPKPDETRRRAAKAALEAHEATLAAHAALEAALTKRDSLYASAGHPSAHEFHRHTQRHAHNDGRISQVRYYLSKLVSDFPTEAVKTVAEGGEVPTAEQIEAMARESIRANEQRTIAAARERGRRQEIIDHNSSN